MNLSPKFIPDSPTVSQLQLQKNNSPLLESQMSAFSTTLIHWHALGDTCSITGSPWFVIIRENSPSSAPSKTYWSAIREEMQNRQYIITDNKLRRASRTHSVWRGVSKTQHREASMGSHWIFWKSRPEWEDHTKGQCTGNSVWKYLIRENN